MDTEKFLNTEKLISGKFYYCDRSEFIKRIPSISYGDRIGVLRKGEIFLLLEEMSTKIILQGTLHRVIKIITKNQIGYIIEMYVQPKWKEIK